MTEKNLPKIIVIIGPTASGKTAVAVDLAHTFNGEIISADSRQVYNDMDIGTGKDLAEYGQGKNAVPYHLIDVASPRKQFSVGRHQKMAYTAIKQILKRERLPIIVGGTGLYVRAIVEGLSFPKSKPNVKLRSKLAKLSLEELCARLKKLDPKIISEIDMKNRRRVERAIEICETTGVPLSEQRKKNPPPYEFLEIGLDVPREELYKKIEKRLDERLRDGMIKEVENLREQGISWKRLDDFGLEYRYVSRFLHGDLTTEQMRAGLLHAICDFAKRQMTWFRKDKQIVWVGDKTKIKQLVSNFL